MQASFPQHALVQAADSLMTIKYFSTPYVAVYDKSSLSHYYNRQLFYTSLFHHNWYSKVRRALPC